MRGYGGDTVMCRPENLGLAMERVLIRLGAPEEDARTVSDVLMRAEMRGFGSHGIMRFPKLIAAIEHGFQRTKTEITIERETEGSALINGNSGLGMVVAVKATAIAIEKARSCGIAAVGVHNTNHFGMAGYYSEMAALSGMIGIVFCNTEPAMAAFGGKTPVLGTNPISVAAPTMERPVVFDAATTNIARGKVSRAISENELLPDDCALDRDGNPTVQPEEFFSLLPLGGKDFGYKGYGLSFVIDLLCGSLVGAASGKDVRGTTTLEKCTKGDFFVAINISSFTDLELFKSRSSELVRDVRCDCAMFPGEREEINEKKSISGVEVPDKIYSEFEDVCMKYGVAVGE